MWWALSLLIHPICSASTRGRDKEVGGRCETGTALVSTSVSISLRLPGQVSFLDFLWTRSGIHRLKKETELTLAILGIEESLIKIVSAGALCIASVTSFSCSSPMPHINNSLCSSLPAAPLLFASVQLLAMQHSPLPLSFQHFPPSLAVEMQLGLLLLLHLLPLPEGWKSLFCCSHALILPDKPAEELLHYNIKLFVHWH